MEYTVASEVVFTDTSKDVEYSFKKNKYYIFVVSSRTTFHHVDQKTLNHFKSKLWLAPI